MEKFEVIQLSSLDIADLLQADHIGPEVIIERVSSLKKLRPNSLVWSKASNVDQLLNFGKQNPIFAIVPMQTELTGISGVCVTQPRDSFSKCLKSFFCAGLEVEISNNSIVDDAVTLGKNVAIGAGSQIIGKVEIQDNVRIWDNVTIFGPGVIGHSTEILSGARIGVESLAVTQSTGRNELMPQIGGFAIGNYCRLGVNSIVAKGTIDDTSVGNNVVIGERVVIGHNSEIGNSCVLTVGTTICGSVCMEGGTWVGPSATILQGVQISKDVKLGAGSVLFNNAVKPGTYLGNPARRFSISKD